MSLQAHDTNPHRPDADEFRSFEFQTIGKQPGLLERMSHREAGARYSPSPEPEAASRQENSATERRNRPSLLEALTHGSALLPVQESDPTAHPNGALARTNGPPEHALQDPETPSTDPAVSEQRRSPNRFLPRTQPLTDTSPSSFSPLSSYLPDYPALKELHTRLEMSYRVLAIPPVPKRIPTPPPDLSLSSLDKTIQTAKLGLTSTTEAVASAKARVLTAEQNVAAARALVDSLKQALDSASTSLRSAEATLTDAARHASDVNATNESSKQTLGSLEETRRLMLEERQPRPRSPSPAPPKQIMGVMKKDLDAFRTWIDEQEHGHKSFVHTGPAIEPSAGPDCPSPIDPVSTLATHGVKGVTTRPPEEDAAQTLVQFALASQGDHAVASDVPMTFLDSESLAHEAALRKSQEIRREQIRLQKEQAQAAAALSILKEREDHVQEFAAPSVDIATTSAPPYQPQPKKGKPTSGGVKLGLSAGAPSVTEFSTEVERAAALGLRVRTKLETPMTPSLTSLPPKSFAKKSRQVVYSTPPEPKSSSPEEFSAHRTGSDGGNLPILQPQAHRRLSDAQVVDLRTTLRGPSLPPVEHLPQARSPSPHHTFIKMEETDRRELLHRPSIVSQNTVQKNTPKVVAPKAVTSKVVTQHAPNKSSSKVVAPQVVAPKKAASAKAGAAQPNTATVSKKLAGANKHHSPPPRERSRSPDQYRNRPPSPSGWMPPRISDQHPPPSASHMQDSLPTGPRQRLSKRTRAEDDYGTLAKRMKPSADSYHPVDSYRPVSPISPRFRPADHPRAAALEMRMSTRAGESTYQGYGYESDDGRSKGDGLLSRLSDPSLANRGRGRGNVKSRPSRGRGNGGERSLVDRMER